MCTLVVVCLAPWGSFTLQRRASSVVGIDHTVLVSAELIQCSPCLAKSFAMCTLLVLLSFHTRPPHPHPHLVLPCLVSKSLFSTWNLKSKMRRWLSALIFWEQLLRTSCWEFLCWDNELVILSSGNRIQVGIKNLIPEKDELVSLLPAFHQVIFGRVSWCVYHSNLGAS